MYNNIAVIGAGVIGLPSALLIQQQLNAKVTIFADELSPNTTGDVAAGLWTPYLLQNTPDDKIREWSKSTQDYILSLWHKGEAKNAGLSLQMVMVLTADPSHKLPSWIDMTLGYSELKPEHLRQLSSKYGQKFTCGYSYMAFVWEAARFLPYLQRKFVENGGNIVVKRIENFDQLSNFDCIVNCCGLQARKLVPDPTIEPIRGQIARVQAPWQFHAIFVNIGDNGNYIIPNFDCVILGGTHQVGDYNLDVNEDDKDFIINGNQRWVPRLETAEIIKHQTGLRPGRPQIRLELENRRIGDRFVKIVHNYGHGGSGVTLSIGCANEAAKLVKQALNPNKL